ncbi:MAG: LapA family protein [Planctomycetota bacterium]|nr:LapA family protein [Planctomycetota bacterium]
MKTLKLVLMLVVAVTLAAVVLQNRALVEVQFLWWTGTISMIVLLLLTVVGGFILGLVTALLVKNGSKSDPLKKG